MNKSFLGRIIPGKKKKKERKKKDQQKGKVNKIK